MIALGFGRIRQRGLVANGAQQALGDALCLEAPEGGGMPVLWGTTTSEGTCLYCCGTSTALSWTTTVPAGLRIFDVAVWQPVAL
ncbi:hypothetical protein IX54_09570 [Paracoccus sanguinis]|nr:hypothetical protein IX54_09570 [Paracoccus sanguinis]